MRFTTCITYIAVVLASYGAALGQEDLDNRKYSIDEPSNIWVLDMVDSLRNVTDLCSNCDSPPTFKRYIDKYGDVLYRLRYACDPRNSVIRIFDERGAPVTQCLVIDGVKDCNDFEAYSNFTFSPDLLDIWSCKRGFNCVAKDRLGLFRSYDINASGSECRDKVRELSINSEFVRYSWYSSEGVISDQKSVPIAYSGQYDIQVTDPDGCTNKKSEMIHVYQERSIPVEGDKILCEDEITQLRSSGYASYKWSNGDTTDHVVIEDPGSYLLEVTNELGCKDSINFEVVGVPHRDVDIRAGEESFFVDQVIPVSLELDGLDFEDIKSISWTSTGELTCDDCPTPFGKFGGESDIQVLIEDKYSCFYEDDITVEPVGVFKEVYGANIFTPNGDGENDLFMIRSLAGAATVHFLTIYNRWGVPLHQVGLHEINDENFGWDGMQDGAPAPTGCLLYTSDAADE